MIQLPGRHRSSWRCVQVLILTLAIIFLPVPASALESGIDLLVALNLHTNYSNFAGVSQVKNNGKPYYNLLNENKKTRELVLPSDIYRRASDAIRQNTDFTFAANVKQEEMNVGTIISFAHGDNRYLELQSSGRKQQIRFHYQTTSIDGKTQLQMETFSYNLADNDWHKVALSVSGSEIQLLIDCRPLYRRGTHFLPDRSFNTSNLKLFVGQSDKDSQFRGSIEAASIIPGPYGYLAQCPNADSECPTCGQFTILQNTNFILQQRLLTLEERLIAAENRISKLETCDCKKSCRLLNDTIIDDGQKWSTQRKCETCKCEQGQSICEPVKCRKLDCRQPVLDPGECCPVCKKECYMSEIKYQHLDNVIVQCKNCTCYDGTMSCPEISCQSILSCPSGKLLNTTGCCAVCQGDDYCSKGHACHTNATCLNLNTQYMCTCAPGFQGDGFKCTDIDECLTKGGTDGNHCNLHTKCKNTLGSYECECLPGYQRHNLYNCNEINECILGQHNCHLNASCQNTQGSYHCQCNDGYEGDGYQCKPICEHKCLNGGKCLLPGKCVCPNGFTGQSCERDLDECASEFLHTCKNSSKCINMPGWYFCECRSGYVTMEGECIDIDECFLNTHSCHLTADCVNTNGHFECHCDPSDLSCKTSCMFESREISDGGYVRPRNNPCQMCVCNKGVISCEENSCNCSTWKRTDQNSGRDYCCPQCDPRESCSHQILPNVVFQSGEQWIHNCQACDCLFGEIDCVKLECPPLSCDNPLPLAEGDCCPRCPDDPCSGLHFPDLITSIGGNSTVDKLISKSLSSSSSLSTSSTSLTTSRRPCQYLSQRLASGQTITDSSQCTKCACKDGHLRCSYISCTFDELEVLHESSMPIGNVNVSNHYTTSKTTFTTTATTAISKRATTTTTQTVSADGGDTTTINQHQKHLHKKQQQQRQLQQHSPSPSVSSLLSSISSVSTPLLYLQPKSIIISHNSTAIPSSFPSLSSPSTVYSNSHHPKRTMSSSQIIGPSQKQRYTRHTHGNGDGGGGNGEYNESGGSIDSHRHRHISKNSSSNNNVAVDHQQQQQQSTELRNSKISTYLSKATPSTTATGTTSTTTSIRRRRQQQQRKRFIGIV